MVARPQGRDVEDDHNNQHDGPYEKYQNVSQAHCDAEPLVLYVQRRQTPRTKTKLLAV